MPGRNTGSHWIPGSQGLSIAQQEVLALLGETADETGLCAPLDRQKVEKAGFTIEQAKRAAESIVARGLIGKRWNPDRYVWQYQLPGRKPDD